MDRVAVGRVFIVDDSAPFRTVARALLESGGYRVVGDAATGAEALAGVPEADPDIVLLDVALPDMDGFSVCRALHRTAPGATVVFCSVRDAEHYGDAVERSSAAGFLPKSTLSAAALALIVARQADRR
ncbi:response regulator transcription factor [Frankia sp. Cppng1_Ct_nod]|uniref:response regulator transcription factor n=1 Tax=Frankia sp. Cppng1_Ct_nod TaxID=2897162 RepID=UPI00104198F5|nr:response regulator transcription factor [Frankia sp. Cppng1_Ct_nod]